MRKRGLRGVLLGVSLALLLAGGVALAQGLFFTVDKECVECSPDTEKPTESRYLLGWTYGGFNPQYELCERATHNGVLLYDVCGDVPSPDPCSIMVWFPCSGQYYGSAPVPGLDADVSNGLIIPLGEWVVRYYQEIPGAPYPWAEDTFVVAEDCSAYEFVPEPGSMLLLGSGLLGVAGYAALRLLSGQPRGGRFRE